MNNCTKRPYRTELAAKVALASTQAVHKGSNREETRYYKCSKGNHYHLTSLPKNGK